MSTESWKLCNLDPKASKSCKNNDFNMLNVSLFWWEEGGGEHVQLVSQNPYPIIVYSVGKYRPHLSHFRENVIFEIPT